MDNLPKDKNQKTETPSIVIPEDSSTIPPEPPVQETPSSTPSPSASDTPPTTPSDTPPTSPTINTIEEKSPEEQPIEIGSLSSKEPTFTSYTEEETNQSEGKKSSKSKKGKTIASVLGILLIIASLPITVILVKQRQELRKEAACSVEPSTGTITKCDVTVSAGSGSSNCSNLTAEYIFKNNSSKTVDMTVHLYGCACDDGNRDTCGTSSGDCNSDEKNITIGAKETKTIPWSTPSKNNCGTFQTDLFIMSCKQR